MISDRLGKALRSIHTRLLLVMILCGVGIQVLLGLALIAHRAIVADALRSSVGQYVQYLVKDLGMPPDFKRAVELGKHTGMTVYYFAPGDSWSTSGQPPADPIERIHTWHNEDGIEAGVIHGRHYLIYRQDPNRTLLFEIDAAPAKEGRLAWAGLLLVLPVSLLLAGSYLWIRRIMAPLHTLTQGVRQVGGGRLDHRVPVQRSDELGELADSFNSMAGQLQTLIGSKERMLMDVSHELRSPLTRMKIALEMSSDGPLKESLGEDIAELEQMVTAILANSRARSGNLALNRQKVDLVALIHQTIRPFENQSPNVIVQRPLKAAEARVDPEKVRTLLGNIIENAIKYSEETSGPIKIRLHSDSTSHIIEIEDDGIGIPAEDLPFVFEPFYRVDRSRSRESGGFGLGLSLCKNIMEMHGGSISVQSTAGKGTTVVLQFPREKP